MNERFSTSDVCLSVCPQTLTERAGVCVCVSMYIYTTPHEYAV